MFAVALVAAAVSVCVVPPSAAYAGYINWTVIITLFCFMLCVAGLRKSGVFGFLSGMALGRIGNDGAGNRAVHPAGNDAAGNPSTHPAGNDAAGNPSTHPAGGAATGNRAARKPRSMAFTVGVLVALPFVVSMFVTNDVALIAFVPFACMVLDGAGRPKLAAVTVVLQAIAANMGSMLTPFGNPQNLYIYHAFDVAPLTFLQATGAITVFNAVLLAAAVALVTRRRPDASENGAGENRKPGIHSRIVPGRDAALFGAAFVVCVLAVLRLIPVWVMLVVCLAVALARDWRLLGEVDWFLLGTFLCFFVFSGNLAAIPVIRDALTGAMDAQPFWIPLAASQVISNVPAAALLTPFTANWTALLLAVDIGGLGTPIASLASLIAWSLYRQLRPEGSDGTGRWMVLFLVLNAVFLAFNCVFYTVLL